MDYPTYRWSNSSVGSLYSPRMEVLDYIRRELLDSFLFYRNELETLKCVVNIVEQFGFVNT